MSAPDTNIDVQEERHKGPLVGMPLAAVLASVVFLAVLGYYTLTGADDPAEVEVTAPAAASQ